MEELANEEDLESGDNLGSLDVKENADQADLQVHQEVQVGQVRLAVLVNPVPRVREVNLVRLAHLEPQVHLVNKVHKDHPEV